MQPIMESQKTVFLHRCELYHSASVWPRLTCLHKLIHNLVLHELLNYHPNMPHLVFCAAAAAIIPQHKARSEDSDRARISRGSSQDENPLLERFLTDCTMQHFAITPCDELRSDLLPLRRVGKPLAYSTSSLSGGSNTSVNSCTCEFGTRGSVAIPNEQATKSLLNLPGLSFADYVWATSASRKMRFEAIYI
jgi:hypothetical protein